MDQICPPDFGLSGVVGGEEEEEKEEDKGDRGSLIGSIVGGGERGSRIGGIVGERLSRVERVNSRAGGWGGGRGEGGGGGAGRGSRRRKTVDDMSWRCYRCSEGLFFVWEGGDGGRRERGFFWGWEKYFFFFAFCFFAFFLFLFLFSYFLLSLTLPLPLLPLTAKLDELSPCVRCSLNLCHDCLFVYNEQQRKYAKKGKEKGGGGEGGEGDGKKEVPKCVAGFPHLFGEEVSGRGGRKEEK